MDRNAWLPCWVGIAARPTRCSILAIHHFSEGTLAFDANGDWARQGRIDEDLVGEWLQEPYFQLAPPKSTGRELFGADDLHQRLAAIQSPPPGPGGEVNPADVLATLGAFTAALVAQDLGKGTRPLELLVAGGELATAS